MENLKSRTLFIVATPIGNLQDITFRAVETLKNVDIVACEDTRRGLKLLSHFNLKKRLERYDEHSHARCAPKIIQALEGGKSVALITDAGTPGISDPGGRLVQAVLAAGFGVIPIPGPSSVVAALSATPHAQNGFIFLGFPPRKKGKAKRILQEALGLGRTVVVLESPFRIQSTLEMVQELAPESEVVLARELTKIHEEFVRGTIPEIQENVRKRTIKGEIVLIFNPEKKKERNG